MWHKTQWYLVSGVPRVCCACALYKRAQQTRPHNPQHPGFAWGLRVVSCIKSTSEEKNRRLRRASADFRPFWCSFGKMTLQVSVPRDMYVNQRVNSASMRVGCGQGGVDSRVAGFCFLALKRKRSLRCRAANGAAPDPGPTWREAKLDSRAAKFASGSACFLSIVSIIAASLVPARPCLR